MADRFKPVPLKPPLASREFHTQEDWEAMIGRRVGSAVRGGALVPERLGPRGGWRYGILFEDAWREWAERFNERARRHWQGRRAAAVERALLGESSSRAKRLRERAAAMRKGRV